MKTVERKVLNGIINSLVEEFRPEEIHLFGSHAWGSPHEDSDLDLLVVVSQSDETPRQRASRAYRCLRGVMVPLDILVKTRSEVRRFQDVRASLVSQVFENGKILYERGKAVAGA